LKCDYSDYSILEEETLGNATKAENDFEFIHYQSGRKNSKALLRHLRKKLKHVSLNHVEDHWIKIGALKTQVQHFVGKMWHGKKLQPIEY